MPPQKEMNLRPQLVNEWNKISSFQGWSLFQHVPQELKEQARAFLSNADVHILVTTDQRLFVFMSSSTAEWPQAEVPGLNSRDLVDLDVRFGENGLVLQANGTALTFSHIRPNLAPKVARARGVVAVAKNAHNRLVVNRLGQVTAYPGFIDKDEEHKVRLELTDVRAIACSPVWSLAMNSEGGITRWRYSATAEQTHFSPIKLGGEDVLFKHWACSGQQDVLLLSQSGNVYFFANADEDGKISQLLLPEPMDHVVATGADLYAARGENSGVYYVWGNYVAQDDDEELKMKKQLVRGKDDKKTHKTDSGHSLVKTDLRSLPEVIVNYARRQDTPHVMWITDGLKDNEQANAVDVVTLTQPKEASTKKAKKTVKASKRKATKQVSSDADADEDEDQDEEGEDEAPAPKKTAAPKKKKVAPKEDDNIDEPGPSNIVDPQDHQLPPGPSAVITRRTRINIPVENIAIPIEPKPNKKNKKTKNADDEVVQPEASNEQKPKASRAKKTNNTAEASKVKSNIVLREKKGKVVAEQNEMVQPDHTPPQNNNVKASKKKGKKALQNVEEESEHEEENVVSPSNAVKASPVKKANKKAVEADALEAGPSNHNDEPKVEKAKKKREKKDSNLVAPVTRQLRGASNKAVTQP